MFPEWGFVDTLGQYSSINHDSGFISFAANPYAAMPSLHAMDALIVGIVMFGVVRSTLGEGALARVAGMGRVRGHLDREPLLARHRRRVRARARDRLGAPTRPHAATAARMTDEQPASEPARVNQLDRVKQEYTQAAREILRARCAGSRRRS